MAASKNNPTVKGKSGMKMAISDDCINCKNQCAKGKQYIAQFKLKKTGFGVACPIK